MVVEQLLLALEHIDVTVKDDSRQRLDARDFDLHADELGADVLAVLVEPVGIDESRRVLVRVRGNGGQRRVFVDIFHSYPALLTAALGPHSVQGVRQDWDQFNGDIRERSRNVSTSAVARSGPANASRDAHLIVCCRLAAIVGLSVVGFLIYVSYQAFTKDIPEGKRAAEQFLDSLKEKKIDETYASMSSGFRSRRDAQQFRDFLKKHDAFTRHTSRVSNNVSAVEIPGAKKVIVELMLHAPQCSMNCTLELVPEDGTWKVDKITIGRVES